MTEKAMDRAGGGRAAIAVVAAIVAAAVGYFAFIRSTPDTPPNRRTGEAGGPATPSPEPLLEGWTTPAAVIVLTGEQHGYVEPCGCSENQSGGLGRRFDLFRQLREKRQWPTAGFDLGGALNPDRVLRAQESLKFEFTRNAQHAMGYAGAGLGTEELLWGAENLFNLFSTENAAEKKTAPFLSTNVELFGMGTRDSLGTPLGPQVVTVGEVRVGVASVFGATYRESAFPGGVTDEQLSLSVQPPSEALPAALQKLKEEAADVLILLSFCPPAESEALATQFPEFDIVVTAGAGEAPPHEPGRVGKTLLLRLGEKGKYAGVLGVFPDAEPRFKFELVELDKYRFRNAPEMISLMKVYQERLQAERPEGQEPTFTHPGGSEYAGVDACKKCHTKAYAIWHKSKHAHAFESLDKGRPGEEATWVNRQFDAECLACHVTGWDPQQALRYESGFVDFATTPHLAGQQCENCHGPAATHVDLELALQQGGAVTDEHTAARKALHLLKDQARTTLCIKCHDLDNSPTFDSPEKTFAEYWWPKVEHKGKD